MIFRKIQQMSNARKETIRRRLAIAYGIIAWNGFAICLYHVTKSQKEKSNLSAGLYEAATSPRIESTKVIRFSGLSHVETIDYNKEDIKEAREKMQNIKETEYRTDDF